MTAAQYARWTVSFNWYYSHTSKPHCSWIFSMILHEASSIEMMVADGLALISRQGIGNHQDDVGRSVHSEYGHLWGRFVFMLILLIYKESVSLVHLKMSCLEDKCHQGHHQTHGTGRKYANVISGLRLSTCADYTIKPLAQVAPNPKT